MLNQQKNVKTNRSKAMNTRLLLREARSWLAVERQKGGILTSKALCNQNGAKLDGHDVVQRHFNLRRRAHDDGKVGEARANGYLGVTTSDELAKGRQDPRSILVEVAIVALVQASQHLHGHLREGTVITCVNVEVKLEVVGGGGGGDSSRWWCS